MSTGRLVGSFGCLVKTSCCIGTELGTCIIPLRNLHSNSIVCTLITKF